MKLAVCALADLDAELRRLKPAGVVSLLGPDQPAPEVGSSVQRLVLRFHDIAEPQPGLVAADDALVGQLLDFPAQLDANMTLLLHCWMGISRSPAAAFVLACALAPQRREADIAQALRLASPTATPNPLLVRLADDRLGRAGRMVAASAAIGRGREAGMGSPFEIDLTI